LSEKDCIANCVAAISFKETYRIFLYLNINSRHSRLSHKNKELCVGVLPDKSLPGKFLSYYLVDDV
jgi:hypothetical protein